MLSDTFLDDATGNMLSDTFLDEASGEEKVRIKMYNIIKLKIKEKSE
ncbi:MAG: hypothetical protein ACYCXQ_03435 [Candidatus Humimicrobiaceae bacterium]